MWNQQLVERDGAHNSKLGYVNEIELHLSQLHCFLVFWFTSKEAMRNTAIAKASERPEIPLPEATGDGTACEGDEGEEEEPVEEDEAADDIDVE